MVLPDTVRKAVFSACQIGLMFWKLSNAVGPVTGFCSAPSCSAAVNSVFKTSLHTAGQSPAEHGQATGCPGHSACHLAQPGVMQPCCNDGKPHDCDLSIVDQS